MLYSCAGQAPNGDPRAQKVFGLASRRDVTRLTDLIWFPAISATISAPSSRRIPRRYVSKKPKARMPLYHLVGALYSARLGDLVHPIGDGFPETLDDWMRRDGLTHLKVKLNGENLDWDVDRFVGVDRVAETVQCERGVNSGITPPISTRNARMWAICWNSSGRCANARRPASSGCNMSNGRPPAT